MDEFNLELEEISNINNSKIYEIDSTFRTIYLNSGKKNKLRAGRITSYNVCYTKLLRMQ